MMFYLKMSWRNIFRHKRRSLVTLLSVVSGVLAIVMFGGFIQANYEGLRESVIRSQYGHLQIHRAGYIDNHRQSPEKYRLNANDTQSIIGLLEKTPHYAIHSRRLEFTGLLGNGSLSEAAVIRSVDPDNESLINSAMTIIDGQDLDTTTPDGALLGEGLAQAINAKVGDQLTLVVSTANGTMNAVDITVKGIFRSFAKEYDDRAMLMGIDYAQTALGTQGVDTVVLLLDDTAALDKILPDLKQRAQKAGLHVEYEEWFNLATFYQKVVDLYDGFFAFIVSVIAVVILFGITNTMMIAVMERTTEIGTLRALGTPRHSIVKQFLTEGLVLALISSVIGVLLAIAAAKGLTSLQIMMPAPPGSSRGYPLRISMVPIVWGVSIMGVLAIALLATYFPATTASRKPIVDALRHV